MGVVRADIVVVDRKGCRVGVPHNAGQSHGRLSCSKAGWRVRDASKGNLGREARIIML